MSVASVPFRCLLVGVGGQGVQTAAAILGEAAAASGLDVRVGWLHGMSQRGGSVQNTVLIGPGSTSIIDDGQSDLVLGFEPLETQRALRLMNERTRVALNTSRLVPYSLTLLGQEYPSLDRIEERIRRVTQNVSRLDALETAREAGDPRALNIVMLGAAASLEALPVPAGRLLESIGRHGPGAAARVGRRAFEMGMKAAAAASGAGR